MGRSKVRSTSLVRILSDGKISWARGPKVCVILHLPQLKESNTGCFEKKKKKKEKPEGETPSHEDSAVKWHLKAICMRTWQSPYEIIGDGCDLGGHLY